MPGLEAVIDVIYNPDKTELILRAEELGVPVAVGGLEMLVAQAVYAAEFFLDRKFEDAGAEIARVTSELRREQLNIASSGCPPRANPPWAALWRNGWASGSWIWTRRSSRPTAGASRISLPLRGRQASGSWKPRRRPALPGRTGRSSPAAAAWQGPGKLRALHANGIVLFIDRPLEDLLVGGYRPLSTSPEALKVMEAQRRPLYLAAADAVIPNKTTPADAVTAAMEALDEIFSH